MSALWRLSVAVPVSAADEFEAALGSVALSVTRLMQDGGPCRIEALAFDRPGAAELDLRLTLAAAAAGVAVPPVSVERLAEQDWLALNREQFAPFRIGPFYLRQSDDPGVPPLGAIDLRIDAAMAFGSGRHASTEGCLRALHALARRRRFTRPLDLGCGTGVLAIAMARLWRAEVIATDIDPRAAATARRNAALNGVWPRVRAVAADGYRHPMIARRAPFDLIVANILARPLRRMAGSLAQHLQPGGVAVLSGLLVRSAAAVTAVHAAHGLRLAARIDVDGWRTLVLQKTRVSRRADQAGSLVVDDARRLRVFAGRAGAAAAAGGASRPLGSAPA